jgi:hypothetical protein
MPLKKVVSWLKRGQYVPFLREICSPQKKDPKSWPFIDGHNRKAVNSIGKTPEHFYSLYYPQRKNPAKDFD